MHTTKTIKNFTELELQKGIKPEASWHNDYKDSSYVFTGGLHFDMNEGDISIVFSQYGEIVDVHLVRNKKTGKSRGFAFVSFEDQRSTVLAVDNLNNAEVCGRSIRVDHVKKYRPPREYLEVKDDDIDFFDKIYKPSGPDGKGWGKYREADLEEKRLMKEAEENEMRRTDQSSKLLDDLSKVNKLKPIDDDERWELRLMKQMNKEFEEGKNKLKLEKKARKEEKKKMKKEKHGKKEKDKVQKVASKYSPSPTRSRHRDEPTRKGDLKSKKEEGSRSIGKSRDRSYSREKHSEKYHHRSKALEKRRERSKERSNSREKAKRRPRERSYSKEKRKDSGSRERRNDRERKRK